MIRRVEGEPYRETFALVYNSANHFFREEERAEAGPEIFAAQLEEHENYVYEEDGEICAFLSYREYEECFELTSLYVKQEYQGKGVASALLEFFEKRVPEDHLIFMKVLKNAPWALAFYQKHGYRMADDPVRLMEGRIQMEEEPWSVVLCRKQDGSGQVG